MRRAVPLALGALLLTGCGLPVTGGARSAGGVPDERSRVPAIKVLPPGPQPGATAEDVVRGFLRAQSSPDDDHAVARQFLAPGVEWDDDRVVVVYEPGTQTVRQLPDDPGRVSLTLDRVALIGADGAYRPLPGAASSGPDEFTVAPVDGQLRLTRVPDGLRLQTADLARSLVPRDVYFLGRSTTSTSTGRLVADRVFLPVVSEPARALVDAVVRGPSDRLEPAVSPAVPDGTRAVDVEVDGDRVVTVTLTEQVLGLSRRDLQRLSAQLVWTLQEYAGVRLRVGGRVLDVEAAGDLQTVEDWDEYDPSGLAADAPVHYVLDRRLDVFGGSSSGGRPETGGLPVDEVAVDPAGALLGVRTRVGRLDEVRVGPLRGPLGAPALTSASLGSLSWGSGDRGLWVVDRAGPRSRLLLVPGPTAPAGARPSEVAVTLPAGAGPLQRAKVSRDGARIALVLGEGPQRRLHVGRVQPTADGVGVADVTPVAPDLTDVTDVAWADGTTLAVIARDASAAGLLVLQVAVDGSQTLPLPRPGLDGDLVSIAAAPDRRLVVAAVTGGRTRLLRDDGDVFADARDGSAPAYPG